MADPKRTTVVLEGPTADDLETIQAEMGLNTSDSIRKGVAMLALMIRRQKQGYSPAFIRPDGSVQEIVFL